MTGQQDGRQTEMQTTQPGSHVIIAIDGPSGAGKSTVARRLAQRLGYQYVDSGALYRAAGWLVQQQALSVEEPAAVVRCLEQTPIALTCPEGTVEVWVAGQCVTAHVRAEAVAHMASAVATLPAVRQVMTRRLRAMGQQVDVVMEGRDIGTAVFPDATVKFFLDASLAVRGQRRLQERQQEDRTTLGEVVEALETRDQRDRQRAQAPLVQAPDAHRIDTTDLTVDEVVQIMLSEIQRALSREGG